MMKSLRSRAGSRAMTVVELLAVVALLAILGTLGARTSHEWVQARRVRGEAERLEQVLKSARDLATSRGVPVRVVFSLPQVPGEVLESSKGHPPAPAMATMMFEVPADGAQLPRVQAPTSEFEGGDPAKSRKTEWMPVAGGPLPEALVGRWIFAPHAPAWQRLDERVVVEGEIFERFRSAGATFAAENFARPSMVWGAPSNDRAMPPRSWEAVHPGEYDLIPHPPSRPPWYGPFGESERMPPSPSGRSAETALDVFGARPVRHFPKVYREETTWITLPAIEFRSDGSLACSWTERLTFEVRPIAAGAPVYRLMVDAATGRVEVGENAPLTP